MKTLIFSLIVLVFNLPNVLAQNNTNSYTFWNADMLAIAKSESKEGQILLRV